MLFNILMIVFVVCLFCVFKFCKLIELLLNNFILLGFFNLVVYIVFFNKIFLYGMYFLIIFLCLILFNKYKIFVFLLRKCFNVLSIFFSCIVFVNRIIKFVVKLMFVIFV